MIRILILAVLFSRMRRLVIVGGLRLWFVVLIRVLVEGGLVVAAGG